MTLGWGKGAGVRFDRISEQVSAVVATPVFFVVVLAALLAWVVTLFTWDTGASDLLVDGLTNPVSLLLLLLLHNSEDRAQRALDARQDATERALALVLRRLADRADDPEDRAELVDAADDLIRNAEATASLVEGRPRDER